MMNKWLLPLSVSIKGGERLNHKTHHVAGLVAGEAVLLHFNTPVLSWVTPVVLVGSYFVAVLPDIDQPQSYIGNRLSPVAHSVQMINIRHRTLTHSLLITFLIWLVLAMVHLPPVIVWALTLAYASHWFLDLLNEQGVELLWPLPIRVKLLPSVLAIPSEADSLRQNLLKGILTVIHIFLFIAVIRPIILEVPIIGKVFSSIWDKLTSYLPQALLFWIN